MGCGFQERQHLILQHFTGASAMWPMGCPGNPTPSSSAGDSHPLLYKSPGKLHSEVLAATRLDRCVCFGPESLRQGLPGGGDKGWLGSHVAILPASGHTEHGPQLKTLPPRDSGWLSQRTRVSPLSNMRDGRWGGLERLSDMSKVLTELGSEFYISWIPDHLRHLLSIFNNIEKCAAY